MTSKSNHSVKRMSERSATNDSCDRRINITRVEMHDDSLFSDFSVIDSVFVPFDMYSSPLKVCNIVNRVAVPSRFLVTKKGPDIR